MVVEACVENGAHHIDISGEPGYLEKMQLNYHAKVNLIDLLLLMVNQTQ